MKREIPQAPTATLDQVVPSAAQGMEGRPAELVSDLSRLGFLSQLCLSAGSVERALQEACRFSALWSAHAFSLQHEDERLIISAKLAARAADAAPGDGALELVLLWLRLAACVAGAPLHPERVRAPAEDCARLRERLACHVEASPGQIELILPAADARRENPAADERLFRVLLHHAEERLLDQLHAQSVSERLYLALLQLDDNADSRAEARASRLGLGVRTLHRRLRAEGTSYRKVLTSFQMRRCIERLACPSASAKQVAFALGFSDPASFYRAFKRWTGHTVSEYRVLHGWYAAAPAPNADGDAEHA
jgi:AraC-like DNA-binding protein